MLSGDPAHAEIALAAVRPLLEPTIPHLVTSTPAGPVLEESPSDPPSHILNGWIYTLWGLWDVHVGLESREAGALFESSLEALRRMIGLYDVGWWSRYSLYPHRVPDLAKPFYHRLHADQCDVLFRLTGMQEFKDAARAWHRYDTAQRPWRSRRCSSQRGTRRCECSL
jgi:heparosan-N-sulfate-glucuronate 5-epimerase